MIPQSTEKGCNVREAAEAVARRSYGKLVAFLAASSGDVAAAEDALAEAFVSALAHWSKSGCPDNPEAWLLTVARRKLIDAIRKQRPEDGPEALEQIAVDLASADDTHEIPDRRLALLFACAHPAIDATIRAPLMLQTVLGLEASQIASAFLVSPATMSQRLVRAKNKIRMAGIPFLIPGRADLANRLEAVLDAIYAAYAEGWSDPAGADVTRRDLAEEAIFLSRLVCELLPNEPETLGLFALMQYAEARRTARRNEEGAYVPLDKQDVGRWDAARIEEAEAALRRAGTMGRIGRYQLEAAIQSAHVERRRKGSSNWLDVFKLYDGLVALTGSPVAMLNRAIALAELEGPASALGSIEHLARDVRMLQYQPYWAARAELLARAGDLRSAAHAYEVAIGLEHDISVRKHLEHRRTERLCPGPRGLSE